MRVLLSGVTDLLLEPPFLGVNFVTEVFFLLALKTDQPLPFRVSFRRGFLAGRNEGVP